MAWEIGVDILWFLFYCCSLFLSGLLWCGFFYWLQWHIFEYMFLVSATFNIITTLIGIL